MNKCLEIKWQGKVGQGVATAASTLAEILVPEGKYVQAFPDNFPEERFDNVVCFNRISNSPIRRHSIVSNADVMVILDSALLYNKDLNMDARDDAVYIINTPHTPEYIKGKLNLDNNKLYTLDANSIALEEIGLAIPSIPAMTLVITTMNLMPLEDYKKRLEESLSTKLNSDLVLSNMKTIDRTLKEVKEL